MSEDKNLNGIEDDLELDEMTEALIDTGEAKGSETSEAAEVVVEVEPLTVTLTFGDEDVELDVTENFQLDLRQACQDKNSRFDEFEVEGDLDPQNLRLLMNALK